MEKLFQTAPEQKYIKVCRYLFPHIVYNFRYSLLLSKKSNHIQSLTILNAALLLVIDFFEIVVLVLLLSKESEHFSHYWL